MATTGVGFRWLDILEKEFDKACVELDTSLSELETEEPEVVFGARQKIATLSSCFAQLTHKALTIFQNSAKLEAELVDMRAELVQARAASAGGLQDAGDAAGNVPDAARARAEAAQLARENAALRETVLALHSELFGARLATKYLDKELAGRIQQLQLLGRDMRAELRDSLWAQVEAEILLQRHKTLVRVCRGLSPRPPRPAAPPPARPRTVRVKRPPHLGLGISVTGGREHGVPILISELEAGGPAALTGELYVGDAILAINDLDLTQACHKEAVQALQSVKGDCALCVQFIATDDDDRLSEDNYRFPLYPEDGSVFAPEPDGEGATPTAPRTPDYNNRVESEAGSVSSLEEGATAATGGHYPDYNSINNNLAILDMDDHCIKIQTQIEQVAPLESAPGSPRPLRGVYRPLPAESSADSASTPVHTRRQTLKKKRKPDWRTKGAYRAVDDLHSSDDNQALETQECSPPMTEGAGRASTAALSSTAQDNGKGGSDGQLSARRESKAFRIGSAQRVTGHPATSLQNQIDQGQQTHGTQNSHEPQNSNGAQNSNGPQNSHGPQISYGPPNSHGPRIPEGPQVPHVPLTNGDVVDKCKLRARLLAGDGDPDFGTPV